LSQKIAELGPVASIPRNTNEEIRVSICEFRGYTFIDVRVHFYDGGEWRPTRKGVTLPPEMYPELALAVEALGACLVEMDLLDEEVMESTRALSVFEEDKRRAAAG